MLSFPWRRLLGFNDVVCWDRFAENPQNTQYFFPLQLRRGFLEFPFSALSLPLSLSLKKSPSSLPGQRYFCCCCCCCLGFFSSLTQAHTHSLSFSCPYGCAHTHGWEYPHLRNAQQKRGNSLPSGRNRNQKTLTSDPRPPSTQKHIRRGRGAISRWGSVSCSRGRGGGKPCEIERCVVSFFLRPADSLGCALLVGEHDASLGVWVVAEARWVGRRG